MKQSFKAGEVVHNALSGEGIILGEWGDWVDIDERGIELAIHGGGIYDVRFKSGEMRSINAHWLSRVYRQAKIGNKPVWQLASCPGS